MQNYESEELKQKNKINSVIKTLDKQLNSK